MGAHFSLYPKGRPVSAYESRKRMEYVNKILALVSNVHYIYNRPRLAASCSKMCSKTGLLEDPLEPGTVYWKELQQRCAEAGLFAALLSPEAQPNELLCSGRINFFVDIEGKVVKIEMG